MKPYCLTAFLAIITFPPSIYSSNGGWNDPTKAQYHIQTDEGPERYFKYQTLSGQYRKEKRLEDGTVIGTYGWVDDAGVLRMRDYIADNAGYRILKTKNVFVGRNRPVNEALSIAKSAPAEAGTIIGPARPVAKVTSPPYYTSSPTAPVSQNTYRYSNPSNVRFYPTGYTAEHLQTPVFKYGTFAVPQTTDYTNTPTLYQNVGSTPTVEISPNSVPSSTPSPSSFVTIVPSSTLLPPDVPNSTPATDTVSTTPATIYIPLTTTNRPSALYESTTTRNVVSSSPPSTNYGSPVSSTLRYIAAPTASTLPPPLSSNELDNSFYSSDPQYEHYPSEKRYSNPYVFQNGPTYPIDRRGHTYTGHVNSIGNGYNAQFPQYDGISVTNDGFRYYIPKQYHEEQTLPGDRKSGSFGYIDPFGIRRVVYYNAGPDGFKHRKNNRYVGLNATPYDPRPY